MKHVKWIFVVLLLCSLTSFIEKDKPTSGLNVGDIAPDFKIETIVKEQTIDLKELRGQYVLLSFWASYDALSRVQNISLNNVLKSSAHSNNVTLVSVSFDDYESIFEETVRKDQIVTPNCFVETAGQQSKLYKRFKLKNGFANYLLDVNGKIIAKNISAEELTSYLDI